MWITQNDLLSKNIEIGAITANSKALLDLISDDSRADYKIAMVDGRKYFRVENTALNLTEFNTYNTYEPSGTDSNGNPTYKVTSKTNPSSSNLKKPSAIYRNAVLQKIDYGLANGVMIENPDESAVENINKTLGNSKDVKISSLATEGANSAMSYFYIYITKAGEFGYMVMDSNELIVVYEDDTRERISEVIRYYKVETVTDGVTSSKYIIEIYGATSKEVFEEQTNGILVSQGVNAYGLIKTTDNEIEKVINWGRPPFVEFINNPERITDLQPAKSQIDDIDHQDSKLSNDFLTRPESIINVNGFDGDDPSALIEFLQTVGVSFTDGDSGSISGIEIKIPYEGKQAVISETTKNAYKALQAVDNGTETVSKASSGKALQIMYKPLNMKVLRMYQGLTKSLSELMWFVNEYYKMTSQLSGVETIPQFNVEECSFNFTPDVVFDLVELADIITKLSIVLPPKELLKLLPFVDENNIDEILEELEKQNASLFNDNIEALPVDDTE